MQVRELCQVWRSWKDGERFTAALGDGSAIQAVGRPQGGICEVHSDRGVERRVSTEVVLCEDLESERASESEGSPVDSPE